MASLEGANLGVRDEASPSPLGGPKPSDKEQVALLKQGLHQFIVTMKNMALYPETSQTNLQASYLLHNWLMDYFSKYPGPLVLVVLKDSLTTEGDVPVYTEKPNEQYLAFPLFRDGIQSIIFEPNITEEELRAFLYIMIRFKTTTESDHDDIVTVMWETSFNNIKYVIADEYEEVGPEFDTNALVCSRPPINKPDIDAPYQATAPVEAEGAAPVAKSIGSLFALAETLDFSFAPGGKDGRVKDPHADGKLLPPEPEEDDDEDGFGPFQSSTNIHDTPEEIPANFADDALPDRIRMARTTPREDDDLDSLMGSGGFGKKTGTGNGNGPGNGNGGSASSAAYGEAADENSDAMDYLDSDEDPSNVVTSPFGGALQDLDLSSLSMDESFNTNSDIEAVVTLPDEERVEVDKDILANRANRLKFWGLSSREIKQIAALIQWDETRAKSSSVLSFMLVLLKSPTLKSSHKQAIVNFLTEEFKLSLSKLSLSHMNKFLADLQAIAGSPSLPLIPSINNDLKNNINNPEFLALLCEPSITEESVNSIYEDLRYFLYQLPPSSLFILAELLPQVKTLRLKKLFIELIAWQIPRSEALAKLPPLLNEWAILELISILRAMRISLPVGLITVFSHHNSASVRELTARYVLEEDPDNLNPIAHLIVDKDVRIRELVTPRLVRRRDPSVEAILKKFISESYQRKENSRLILGYYHSFGLTASYVSVSFLTEILMKKDLSSLFGSSKQYHRVGAALALLLMPASTGSDAIISNASRSVFRSVRWAYNEAKKILAQEEFGING
ncbi:MAG: hypothetical protein LBE38_06670 [Deltaproteobacteria bacterium]|jgi:hypothetical protein|nr:hypothetical protein [Deltaproteobacteria bacterium]